LLHGAGLIHRDIKPDNVWLSAPDELAVLLDTGAMRQYGSDVGPSTHIKTMLGAPELEGLQQEKIFGSACPAPMYLLWLASTLSPSRARHRHARPRT
jgi:serine/threonine protein kinase